MEGTLFMVLHEKLNRVKRSLGAWSRATFGNVYQKVVTMEDLVRIKDMHLELDPSEENRVELRKVVAEPRRYQKYEEDIWK